MLNEKRDNLKAYIRRINVVYRDKLSHSLLLNKKREATLLFDNNLSFYGHSYFFSSNGIIQNILEVLLFYVNKTCLLYTSPSPRDGLLSRMPSSA